MKRKQNNTNDFRQRTIAELLGAIHKNELRQLTKYLNAYCTPETQKLWKVIKAKHPKFEVTDDYLRKAVRPGKPITDRLYRVQLAEISKHIKSFITVQEFKENELLYANTLAKTLMKRKAKLNYNITRKKNEELFMVDRKPDADHYQHLNDFHAIDYQFKLLFNPNEVNDSLQLASDNHDYSFLINKLRWIMAMRNRSIVAKKTFNDHNEKEFLNYLTKFPLDELPLIKAYYLSLQLFQETSFERFIEFKEHLFAIRNQFDHHEIRTLLILAGNICSVNIQNGQLEYLEERFSITKIKVEEEFLNILGNFANNHFQGTLRDAIEAQQLSWAYNFLKTKLPNIHSDHQQNVEVLSWAIWYFAKEDYAKQEEFMTQMRNEDYKFTNIYNELSYRILRLKTNYKLLEDELKKQVKKEAKRRLKEAFQNHLQSYIRYSERKEGIPENARNKLINFGLALRLIYNKRFGTRPINNELKTEILNLKPITELPWLLKELKAES